LFALHACQVFAYPHSLDQIALTNSIAASLRIELTVLIPVDRCHTLISSRTLFSELPVYSIGIVWPGLPRTVAVQFVMSTILAMKILHESFLLIIYCPGSRHTIQFA
jgi:hypothetical protein